MGLTCAGATPRSRFVKPYVEAPRQVIGFDLSPKGGTLGMVPHSNDDDDDVLRVDPSAEGRSDCRNSCSISSKTATHKSNTTTATSPRSALQQLLLPPLAQSEPASSLAAANVIGLTHKPLLEPTCISQTGKHCLRGGVPMSSLRMKPSPVDECHDPLPAAAPLDWPILKGIVELVTPSGRATLINDGNNAGSAAGPRASASKRVAGDGKKSCQTDAVMIRGLSCKSERNDKERSWNCTDRLHELPPCRDKSKKSIWMKEIMIGTECPKTSVEIGWKQTKANSPERSKKSSLFVLAASSPPAEHIKHYHLHARANQYSYHNTDMDFLNSCYLCKRLLGQGHDVFMYSGDKAFCSMECRYQQIVIDERKERHTPPIIRSGASPIYRSYMATASSAAVAAAAATATTHHPTTVNRPNFMNPAAVA